MTVEISGGWRGRDHGFEGGEYYCKGKEVDVKVERK